jgi:cytoskeletal protein CcmA (bactofilin family)
MALKFRRGTTAQKSGSLAFGEPFINTDLNTLQIGGASGDITLGTTGESSAFAGVSVSASSFISGSGLKITGNAAIDGNLTLGGAITIGDATADTVNVVASLSSSLIPSNDIAFNVGRNDRRYKELYANVISSSIVELISGSGTEFRLKNTTANTEYHIRNTNTGSFSIHEQTTGRTIFFSPSASLAGELNMFLGGNVNFSGSITANNITATGTISGSTFTGLGNLTTYSSSVASRLGTLEGKDISITLT